ncbi:MAG TPA: hypothetical protein DD738_12135 [Ruminiclostridium sp.]|nr:hypothetical protein [Ruminiclostridium sp.]
MSVRKDDYILAQSEVKNLSGFMNTIRFDLSLTPSPYRNTGTVTGMVLNASGKPVADAIILILDANFNIISNTASDSRGYFIFPALEPGSEYHVYAKAPGFQLSDVQIFDLRDDQILEVAFVLSPDTVQTKGILTGSVQNMNGLPLGSALIELYRADGSQTGLICLSFSNEVGRFVFRDIEQGFYLLKVNAPGYLYNFSPVTIQELRSISSVDVILQEDPDASKGLVMGLITDNEDQPQADADVILYRVGTNQSHTPVAYTRTNQEGIYLFVNIPAGEYCVNSNRPVRVE